jgi:hypothetical protein
MELEKEKWGTKTETERENAKGEARQKPRLGGVDGGLRDVRGNRILLAQGSKKGNASS